MTITELENRIRELQHAYYNGEGLVSDAEFDALWDELTARAPDSPVLSAIGTVSEARPRKAKTGEANADGFPKARHIIPMGSQNKAKDEVEFSAWAKKINLNHFIVQHKLDGISLELQYKKGTLIKAVTRGDGIIGDDISANIHKTGGVPLKILDDNFYGGVRGELIMMRDIWKLKYSGMANSRNTANGIIHRLDGAGYEDISFIAYDAGSASSDAGAALGEDEFLYFKTELEKIEWLKKQGFNTTPAEECFSVKEVISMHKKISKTRNNIPYNIDGLVVKETVTDIKDLREKRPKKQIAFKFPLEEALTILRSVEWSESGATYTPVAHFDEVRLHDTNVKHASLHNPNIIRELGLKIGSAIVVVKRGEIIPRIERAAEADKVDSSLPLFCETRKQEIYEIEFPTHCAVCGAELVDCGTRLYCPNNACPKKLLHRLEKWVAVMNIAEIGEKLLRQLFDAGRVRSVADFYTLDKKELAEYERMGSRSAAKVIKNILTKRTVSLAVFVAAFDIEGVGEVVMDNVVHAGFDTLEKLRNAPVKELAGAYGLGDITAPNIIRGLIETKDDMDAVLAAGIVTIAAPQADLKLPLFEKSFCFTGELKSIKRPQAEARVRELGGTTKTAVVKGLSYLVTNNPESGSAKNKKAHELGIEIINEDVFLNLISI